MSRLRNNEVIHPATPEATPTPDREGQVIRFRNPEMQEVVLEGIVSWDNRLRTNRVLVKAQAGKMTSTQLGNARNIDGKLQVPFAVPEANSRI